MASGTTNGATAPATNGIFPKITLYTNHGCPWAQRAHIVLKELQLPYEEVIIDLDVPRPDWYLKINPVRTPRHPAPVPSPTRATTNLTKPSKARSRPLPQIQQRRHRRNPHRIRHRLAFPRRQLPLTSPARQPCLPACAPAARQDRILRRNLLFQSTAPDDGRDANRRRRSQGEESGGYACYAGEGDRAAAEGRQAVLWRE